jgi:iron complex outermembrane receptor protein
MSSGINRSLFFAGAAVVALGAGASAHAQPAAAVAAPPSDVTEVIVTAQRRAERLQDVPLSITVQSADQLQRQGIANLKDLSNAVPGLRMATTGPNLQPAIRGVSSQQSDPGNDANVAVYLDGVYQANQLINSMDLPDVDHIEVAKGPQGTLFGRNATGGAIQVFTKAPSFTPTGLVSLGYARFNDFTAKGFVSGPIVGDTLAASLSGFYERSDGYDHNVLNGGRHFKGVDAKSVRLKLLAAPTDDAHFTLTLGYTDRYDDTSSHFVALNGNSAGRGVLSANGASLIPNPGVIISSAPYNVVENEPAFIHINDYNASLKGEVDLGFGTLSSITAYDRNRVENDIETDQSSADILFYNLTDRAESFSQELSLASRKMGKLSWVVGGFYYYNKGGYDPIRVHGGSLGNLEIDVFAQQRTHAYAGFGEVNYDLTDRLTVIGGLRYSSEKRQANGANGFTSTNAPVGRPTLPKLGSHSWDSFTPRISLRYRLDEAGDNAYATYSTGFKSGGYSLATLETSPFQPEKIKAFEVGVKTSPARRISGNIAAFYYNYTDQQVQAIVNNFNVTANAAGSHIKGIDADAIARVTPDFDLSAGLSILDAKFSNFSNATTNAPITYTSGALAGLPCFCGNLTGTANVDGNRPVRSPTWTLNLTAAYSKELSAGVFDASASVYHSAKYFFDVENRVHQPGFTTVGARASFRPANTGIKLTVWGQNLTNKHVIQGVFLLNQADGVSYGPPRTFGASVEYAF